VDVLGVLRGIKLIVEKYAEILIPIYGVFLAVKMENSIITE